MRKRRKRHDCLPSPRRRDLLVSMQFPVGRGPVPRLALNVPSTVGRGPVPRLLWGMRARILSVGQEHLLLRRSGAGDPELQFPQGP